MCEASTGLGWALLHPQALCEATTFTKGLWGPGHCAGLAGPHIQGPQGPVR